MCVCVCVCTDRTFIWDYVYLRKSARCGEDDDTKWVCQPKCLQYSMRPDLRDCLTCYRIIIFSTLFRFSVVNLDRLNRLDSHGHTLMLLVQYKSNIMNAEPNFNWLYSLIGWASEGSNIAYLFIYSNKIWQPIKEFQCMYF